MSPTLITVLSVAALVLTAVGSVLVFRALRAERQAVAASAAMDGILRQVEQASRGLNARLDTVTGEMNRTFSQALQQATQALTGSIGTVREETRAAIHEKFVQVTERLGDLKATNERIMEFSRSLDEFQRMLQSPKLRGDFGEFTLEQMLAELVPAEHYDCQAAIGGARVDALIRTPHGVLCIDSKFPLDNFRRALEAGDTPARDAALKLFYGDVRARIDEIADRYVAPPVTLEIAFMFVPAENVYYELLGRPDLLQYGRERRVVPVSPNTMYAYLQAMAIGFRGLKIHQEARRVEQILGELGSRFERFQEHFGKIGRHLESAKAQFDGALRDVQRFEATLQGLKIGRLEIPEPLEELSPSKAADEYDPIPKG
jgi:DNA recombination protein RmuC